MIFLTYFIIYSYLDFLSGDNFHLITIDKILPSPPEINLKKYMLNFGFNIIYDKNNKPLESELVNRYFDIKLRYVIKSKKEKSIKNINLVKCSEKNFNSLYNYDSNFIKNQKYSDYYCMEDSDYSVKGTYSDEIFSYIEYPLSLNWKSVEQEIMNFHSNFLSKNKLKVMFKYFDYSIDVDNLDNPIRAVESEVFDYLNFNMIKKYNLDFSLYEFSDDIDIFLPNPKKK